MKQVAYILLATALTYASAAAAGRVAARILGVALDWFLSFLTGSAILSTLVFLLTAAGLAYKGVFLVLAAILIAASCIYTRSPRPPAPGPWPPRPWLVAFAFVYAAFTWLYLSQALAPEISPDAVAYHTGLIARYYREHHFPRITTDFYANFPAGVEMLFLFAFSIGKHSAASMVEFLYLALTPFGILAWARRAGHPVAGVIAALLFYLSPLAGRDGTTGYIDVAAAAIAFALFYALQLWRENRDPRLLVVAGLIAGFGMAAKYTQILAAIYGACVIAVYGRRRAREPALFSLCAAAILAPWLVKNAIVVHNPVSPFLNRVFPNPYIYTSFETDWRVHGWQANSLNAVQIGLVFVLSPLALFALRRDTVRQTLAAGVILSPACLTAPDARYLIPALPFFALALALAFETSRALSATLVIFACVTSWPEFINRYAPNSWHIESTNWAAALRRIPEEQYLSEHVGTYALGDAIRKNIPPAARIFSESMSNIAYQPRELIVPFRSAFGARLAAMVDQARFPDARPTHRVVFRWPARPFRKIRLALETCGDRLWSVSELRVYREESEIPRQPSWRLRAQPNPWEVQDAFDNSPITSWNASQYHPDAAFIEIEFPAPQSLDRLTADLPPGLGACTMRVESPEGAVAATLTNEPAPYPDRYRRAIAEELKSNGIAWLVVQDDEALAMDLLARPPQWGMTPVAYQNRYRLWRID